MDITESDATQKNLYDLLYELCRKAGMDDNEAVDTALNLQSAVLVGIDNAGGTSDLIPEE